MSAAIHTRFIGGNSSNIRAWTKDGRGKMALRFPYPHELHHSKCHPAAAKALAERLGWSGLWIVGHNESGSICAVQVASTASGSSGTWFNEELECLGIEGEDWFFVEVQS